MRAFTREEAFALAIEDAYFAARKCRRLRKFYTKAKRIRARAGWVPWWDYRPHSAPKRAGSR